MEFLPFLLRFTFHAYFFEVLRSTTFRNVSDFKSRHLISRERDIRPTDYLFLELQREKTVELDKILTGYSSRVFTLPVELPGIIPVW